MVRNIFKEQMRRRPHLWSSRTHSSTLSTRVSFY